MTQDKLMASAHLSERREVRYEIALAIEASGIDLHGQVFHERTVTRDVSKWGCSFLLPFELKPDSIIAITATSRDAQNALQKRHSLFQVVRVAPEGERWLVGTWKMDDEDLWDIELPKSAEIETVAQNPADEETKGPEVRLRKNHRL